MQIKLKSERDFWSGVTFLLTGIGFGWGSSKYSFGDSSEPGPGYFPAALGVLLAVLGLILIAQALTSDTEDGQKIGKWAWKPVLCITAAVAFFGWALPTLGMFIAIPLLILTSAMAGDEFHLGEALASGAVLAIGSWIVFNWSLKLNMPLWPVFLST